MHKGKQVDMPQAREEKLIELLVGDCEEINPVLYYEYWPKLMRGEQLGKNLEQIIGEFKMYQNPRTTNDKQNVAFATFSGQSTSQQSQRCPCGSQKHKATKCYYLNPSLRPEGWEPREIIQKRLQENMQNPETRKLVEQVQNGERSRSQSRPTSSRSSEAESSQSRGNLNTESPRHLHAAYTAFHTPLDEYHDVSLLTSWLLDTAADTHVGNDIRSFRNFRPTYDSTLSHGNTGSTIEGFGEVVIMIEYGNQRREFTLKDVAYVPGFHTNLVCFARLKRAGICFDTDNNRLMYSGTSSIFANLLQSGSFWIVSKST
ncbi:hypothetical protein V1506DRAFT_269586, partial [Lipomyces tetrasporus]